MEETWIKEDEKEESNVIEKVENEIDKIQNHQIIKLPIWAE